MSSSFLNTNNSTTSSNIPSSKRRRLVDTWNKEYDDTTTNSIAIRKSSSSSSSSSSGCSDPMEDLGRQHWLHSNTLPIDIRPLVTACSSSGKWCYFPKQQCNNITWKEMQMHGVVGVHYAIGYKQLGEMIIKYGSDYSHWPRLG